MPILACCRRCAPCLRGLYGSQVSFLYLAAGIFNHQQSPVGIVQCYGVAAFAPTLEEACAQSERSLAALKGAMGGAYRQIRLEPLNVRLAEWIFLSFHDMQHVLVTVGHTDPRENARGGNSTLLRNPLTEAGPTAQQYTLQQNEILFRGMSDLKEEFLFLVLTSPISLADITEMLTGLAEEHLHLGSLAERRARCLIWRQPAGIALRADGAVRFPGIQHQPGKRSQ